MQRDASERKTAKDGMVKSRIERLDDHRNPKLVNTFIGQTSFIAFNTLI